MRTVDLHRLACQSEELLYRIAVLLVVLLDLFLSFSGPLLSFFSCRQALRDLALELLPVSRRLTFCSIIRILFDAEREADPLLCPGGQRTAADLRWLRGASFVANCDLHSFWPEGARTYSSAPLVVRTGIIALRLVLTRSCVDLHITCLALNFRLLG